MPHSFALVVYAPWLVRVSKAGETFVVENPQGLGGEVSLTVQHEREELIQRGIDLTPSLRRDDKSGTNRSGHGSAGYVRCHTNPWSPEW